MKQETVIGRRQVLKISGLALAGAGLLGAAGPAVFPAEKKKEGAEEVSPPEDLMREHGVLRRVLLIYKEFLRRLDTGGDIPREQLSESARIIRTFIEEYHEKLEENYIFPAMRKANRLTELVDVLQKQHEAGRGMTAVILKAAAGNSTEDADKQVLHRSLSAFIRMYEPHAAREDTVLFPALRSVWSEKEFKRMGDLFEKEENRLFGEDGFEKMVDRVAAIEKSLGIYALSQFTP